MCVFPMLFEHTRTCQPLPDHVRNNARRFGHYVPVLRGKALKTAEIKFNKDLAVFAEYQQALKDEKTRKKIENKI